MEASRPKPIDQTATMVVISVYLAFSGLLAYTLGFATDQDYFATALVKGLVIWLIFSGFYVPLIVQIKRRATFAKKLNSALLGFWTFLCGFCAILAVVGLPNADEFAQTRALIGAAALLIPTACHFFVKRRISGFS